MLIKYKRDIICSDDYYNTLLTKCKIFIDVLVGSGYCIYYCPNNISHNNTKMEIDCKNKIIKQEWKVPWKN
jgi:hypothetical protein